MPRARRTRDDLRALLLDSALVEFGAKGFAGASTRSIAERVDAHQPQINYHFASKEALWAAAVDHLFARLEAELAGLALLGGGADDGVDPVDLGVAFAEGIRRFVRFAAAHPELNRIMVHEATEDSDRLRWMVERHVRPLYEVIRRVWAELRRAGIAAPVDPSVAHYVIVGGASLPFVNAPEVRLLVGVEPTDPGWIDTHADGLVETLLPGLAQALHRHDGQGDRPPST